ncbi:MAG TPA: hypothetical protein VLH56_03740 [Dissulfurispiraceae bacterium]|nr:hypothetical protein [Dissulfurispiraceae bacterium]
MNGLRRLLEDPQRMKLLKRVFFAGAVFVALLEVLVVTVLHLGHGYFWFDGLPAFGSLYGLISGVIIIIAAKFIFYPLLSRKEEHYD